MTLGAKDEDWPEWIWCRNAEGLGGWLPASSLSSQQTGETATLLSAFDSLELTVSKGDELDGIEECSGWIRCRNGAGAVGWVPSECLEPC